MHRGGTLDASRNAFAQAVGPSHDQAFPLGANRSATYMTPGQGGREGVNLIV